MRIISLVLAVFLFFPFSVFASDVDSHLKYIPAVPCWEIVHTDFVRMRETGFEKKYPKYSRGMDHVSAAKNFFSDAESQIKSITGAGVSYARREIADWEIRNGHRRVRWAILAVITVESTGNIINFFKRERHFEIIREKSDGDCVYEIFASNPFSASDMLYQSYIAVVDDNTLIWAQTLELVEHMLAAKRGMEPSVDELYGFNQFRDVFPKSEYWTLKHYAFADPHMSKLVKTTPDWTGRSENFMDNTGLQYQIIERKFSEDGFVEREVRVYNSIDDAVKTFPFYRNMMKYEESYETDDYEVRYPYGYNELKSIKMMKTDLKFSNNIWEKVVRYDKILMDLEQKYGGNYVVIEPKSIKASPNTK